MGAFDVPRAGINVAANLQYSSGKPWAKTADIVPSPAQGPRARAARAARDAAALVADVLDLRLSKAFTIGGAGRVELRVDVLNLLNDTAEESIASDRYDSPVARRSATCSSIRAA